MRTRNLLGAILLPALFTACSNGSNTADTPPDDAAGKSKAQILFESKCASCHGADGTAGIGNAANLQTSRADSAAIVQQIQNGKGAMPAFKDQLSAETIQELATYVFSLRK
jgi:mono/diheme cytochrome c family protein